jgi:adenine-specific DNA glycosylase
VTIVLASARRVLLARRRPDVLFGGLWEAPSAQGTIDDLASRLSVDPRSLTSVGSVTHILSHRRLEVEVWKGSLDRRRVWLLPGPEYDSVEAAPLADLGERAQAALTRKVLTVANLPAGGLRSDSE